MAKRSGKQRLSEHIRHLLGTHANAKLLKEIDPDFLKHLRPGMNMPTLAEMLAKKVVRLALDNKQSNQWAIDMVLDRTEGRAVSGVPIKEHGKVVEDRLNEFTTHHLNDIASKYANRQPSETEEGGSPEEGAPGSAAGKLDLPSHRVGRAETPEEKPPMEKGSQGPGLLGPRLSEDADGGML